MSLLEIVRDVCASISLPLPSAVGSSTDPTALRMISLAQEEVESLRSRHNWSALITEATVTTPSVADNIATFTLPADFKRFLRGGGEPNDVSRNFAMGGPSNVQGWQSERVFPGVSPGRWRKFGFSIKVLGGTASDTLRIEYISSYPVVDASDVPKARFSADSDVPRMPENLVRLGLKWRFLKASGMDYAEAMSDYEREFERACDEDRGGARTIILGAPSFRWGGVPDSSLGPF